MNRIFSSDAPRRRRVRSFSTRAAYAAAAFCALSLGVDDFAGTSFFVGEGSAHARESSLSVATPFEVGESASGNYLAAIVAGAERDTLAASTFFREALRSDPRNRELTERAFVAALANGNMQEAFALAARVATFDKNNGLANLTLGVEAIKTKKFAKARAVLAKGGLDRKHDVTSTLLTAWAYAGAGETKQALATADKLKEDAFAVFRDYHAALIADAAKNGDKAEATKRFKSAYGSERNTLRLVDAYGRFLVSRGSREEARRVYRSFDDLAPRHPIVTAAIADIDTGKPLIPFVRDADAGAAEVLYGLGAIGGRQGDELASLIYLRLSLFLAPNNALATITLADIYERMKQEEIAIDLYDSVPKDSPLRVNADVQAALLLETLGKTKEATDHLQSVIAENPKDQEALTALGNIQRSRKLFADSVTTYTKVLDLQPQTDKSQWLLYYYRGIANERRKNWPTAESDLKKALELYPDQPLVLNYLGYSWVDQGVNLDEAFKMLRRAVDLRARDGYVVDSLGWAYYRLGRYDEAVRELEKAVDLKPSDPVINDHLGDAYWRVNRKLEARFQWNHARDMSPDPDDLPKILEKIDKGLSDPSPIASDQTKKKNGG
ncbi:tetratricopeptide repeat protein [Methylosinus sporium]|uniref:Tetratricopeptide repeat protein n=1 Tax=Methylosinus sporium TaxID=428 RepID=A0A549T8M1_METSR|nr:tetratricopeptide repeat protein [Methylosinus sporium]MBU3889877.1 tetratricopeptide repeat protein [Methylosinus sp. KRF6]TRL38200.1 tetratricopeptide repeat protein [Methylosinus sporium]